METLKWYAGKVRDIKPGEFEAELSENVEEIFYNLTVDETGWYRFSYDALSMSVRDKETFSVGETILKDHGRRGGTDERRILGIIYDIRKD